MRRCLDPVAMADAIGMEPDPWQATVLRSNHPCILLNCSRQSGKSQTAAVLAVHAAVYEPGSLVLLVSRALRQSTELFRTCIGIYRALGRPVSAEAESALSLTLENGSRIVSLPSRGDTFRGYSRVRLIVVDEAALVADDTMTALWPMLAVSRGRVIALSTPAGKRGWWWEEWDKGALWMRVKVPATECARIDPEFLAEQRERTDPRTFDQEYMCEFAEAQDAAFRREDIERLVDDTLQPFLLDGWKR